MVCAAVLMLVACGGLQTQIGAPGAMPRFADRSARQPLTVSYKTLYRFKGNRDGASPLAGLIVANGALYGTTLQGGSSSFHCIGLRGCGTVFEISTSGRERVLYRFKPKPDGQRPEASLTLVNGRFYGTTSAGGTCDTGEGCGTVFEVSTSGHEKVLYSFGTHSDDGNSPAAALLAVNGMLYGTAVYGGTDTGPPCYGCGTVFEVSTSGNERVLYTFKGRKDGEAPYDGLLNLKGILYGTTSGGTNSDGTAFSITRSGSERILHDFDYRHSGDGIGPDASLIALNGALYGTTQYGGTSNSGTVCKITTSGHETVLYSFKGAPDGASSAAALTDMNGVLYGTTQYGGAFTSCSSSYGSNGCGVVFKLTPSDHHYEETVLHSFKGGADGAFPVARLVAVDGMLYGTTSIGGGSHNCSNGCGTVFEMKP